MKFNLSAKQMFAGRLVLDLALCCWQVLSVADGRPTDSIPFYKNAMVYLAVTNPAVTLLSTTAFSGFKVGEEWVWVPLYLLTDVVIWGGLWIIIHWLNKDSRDPA